MMGESAKYRACTNSDSLIDRFIWQERATGDLTPVLEVWRGWENGEEIRVSANRVNRCPIQRIKYIPSTSPRILPLPFNKDLTVVTVAVIVQCFCQYAVRTTPGFGPEFLSLSPLVCRWRWATPSRDYPDCYIFILPDSTLTKVVGENVNSFQWITLSTVHSLGHQRTFNISFPY